MIDVHYASLTSRRVQHRVFYLDGHPCRYQPRPTGLNCGEQTGTGVFPLVIAVQHTCMHDFIWNFIVNKILDLFFMGFIHILACLYET